MQIEYTILLSLYMLPTTYKLSKWGEVFKVYSVDSFTQFKTIYKKESDFWFPLEILLLFLSLPIFFHPPFEIFVFSIYFYFGILYSIFVLGKIFRKKFILHKHFKEGLIGILLSVITGVLGLYFFKNIYIVLINLLLLSPSIIFLKSKYFQGKK